MNVSVDINVNIHVITLFQRVVLSERQVLSERPQLFISSSLDGCVSQVIEMINTEFELEHCGDDESIAAFSEVRDYASLKHWFDRHYCFFDISHTHTTKEM